MIDEITQQIDGLVWWMKYKNSVPRQLGIWRSRGAGGLGEENTISKIWNSKWDFIPILWLFAFATLYSLLNEIQPQVPSKIHLLHKALQSTSLQAGSSSK